MKETERTHNPNTDHRTSRRMSEFEFQPGDTIVPLSRPFLKILNMSQKGQVCNNCFQPGDLQRCEGCKLMHYCGESCRKLDWDEGHSVECKSETFKNVAKAESILASADISNRILRALAKFHLDPASFSEKHLVYGTIQRSFNDMISHQETLFKDPYSSQRIQKFYVQLRNHDSSYGAVDFDEKFLQRLLGVWKTNAFGILDMERNQEMGAGLYITASAIDHSCRPNAVWCLGQLEKEIRCIHPIRKGEKVTISYHCENQTREQRQSFLKRHYNFTCGCELCIAEMSGPLVDYKELIPVCKEWTYQEIIEYRERQLELLYKVYHKYDTRITWFCYAVYNSVYKLKMEYGHDVPKSVLEKEGRDMEQRISITFGRQSDLYKVFQQKLSELEIDRKTEQCKIF